VALFDRLLLALNVHVEAFATCEIGPGWRLALNPMDHPVLHYVLTGAGLFTIESMPPVRFARDSLLLIPAGRATKLEPPEGGDREVAGHIVARRTADGLLRLQAGTGESTAIVACGTIRATYGGTLGLFDRLDRVIVEEFAEVPAIRSAIEAVLAELALPRVGSPGLIDALLKPCVVLLLRRQLEKREPDLPWLAATTHPKLGRSVLAMLDDPGERFTLEGLAERSGMSRSSFSEQFADLLGRPPMEFLRELRLRRAAYLLETTDEPIKTIAQSVGYASRSYFSRAFSRAFGVDPSRFREDRRSGVEVSGVSTFRATRED
jgi:AraC-like DNA-binding protein